MKVVYTKLARKMRDEDINQKELAWLLHLSPSALNRRMTGRGDWHLSEIKELCKIFRCKFEDIF